jgi:prophage DNA circulation protein
VSFSIANLQDILGDDIPELLPASWRGVEFYMPSGDYETGRRVVRNLYPGRDNKGTQDLGLDRGPIKITGIITGGDYLSTASDLEAALEQAGPGLLVHPWRGQLNVILTQRSPFHYDAREIRKITFTATFEEFQAPAPAAADTLAASQDAWEDLQDDAQSLISAVLTAALLTLAAVSAVESVCSQVASIWTSAVGSSSDLAVAASAPIAGLSTAGSLPSASSSYAASVGALLAAPSAAIVAASEITVAGAIGPGDAAPDSTPFDARVTAGAILAAIAQLAPLAASTAPAGPVVLAAAAIAVGDAVSAASDIAYTSQQDALSWQQQLCAAIDTVAAAAVTLGPTQPFAAGQVWSACQKLRAAVIVDISAELGRLPQVQTVTLIANMPVWLLTQGLYGDNPAQVVAMHDDLVARNGLANPASIGPGPIEALVPQANAA